MLDIADSMYHGIRRSLPAKMKMTMLLVVCGFLGILRATPPRAVADQTAKLPFKGGGSNSDLTKGAQEDLLERGNNLLREGEITEAVHVLDSVLSDWEEQVRRLVHQ